MVQSNARGNIQHIGGGAKRVTYPIWVIPLFPCPPLWLSSGVETAAKGGEGDRPIWVSTLLSRL